MNDSITWSTVEAHHPRAPVGHALDQPLCFEACQRLPHWDATHAETGGQLGLAQPSPRRDPARDDCIADASHYLLCGASRPHQAINAFDASFHFCTRRHWVLG